jgi:hypothetical protein
MPAQVTVRRSCVLGYHTAQLVTYDRGESLLGEMSRLKSALGKLARAIFVARSVINCPCLVGGFLPCMPKAVVFLRAR